MEEVFIGKLKNSWDEYSKIQIPMSLSENKLSELRVDFELEDDQVAGIVLSILNKDKPYLEYLSNAITTYPIFLKRLNSYIPTSDEGRKEKGMFLAKANRLQNIINILGEMKR